ncbi:NAD-dependent succinate-semialdehyde dehydrogenase [Ancylobacter vacuolatus]|uniref:Succinate-semialdehyde dehydrogenase/glutarate-semialdehyde dehydrogenase n=1 Tax=Ancylobacter vacuolatus TaxID=223389 RepID=A0ABU0DI48_9HYPH|nr:NAD-dependent succinate-semialdehyde dehydrogenase [Ancylobacter vacuolatus]MDQ0348105.1 succinate-semialdehyde dehydrogenase/glutarate-semialdehyde dehydrogenase [Ancylobacter vacuolatus]
MHASLYIGGEWRATPAAKPVINPATGESVGTVGAAGTADLDDALAAAASGFRVWSQTLAHERGRRLIEGCRLIRERIDAIARVMTLEQGKPLTEAKGEIAISVDNLEWMAEEATRAYGRILVPRTPGIQQFVHREPIGPVAAFTPWNFPALTPLRKIAGALAAGCSLILKPSEETPLTAFELVRAFHDAGLPPGVLNLVFGRSAEISAHLIASPVIRKITFTGSTPVGKHLLGLAAQGAKRATMELGGHAPVIVCDDVDVASAAALAVKAKFRNAGQVCTCPTRFFVQEGVYDAFVDAFTAATRKIVVGNGLEPGVEMGPLANARQLSAIEGLVRDAVERGARITTGGRRIGNDGLFYEPTVLADVPDTARMMSEEPFGPVAPIQKVASLDEAVAKANALPFGLASYVMTRSLSRADRLSRAIEAGMVVVNHFTVSTPSSPFGGVKESGYGSEGGVEGLDAYLVTKSVTMRLAGEDLQP